ncbi:DEAD/DEAH box helicase [Cerasicoccus arenae]|uniref:DEAD-box ATP-dependent RNA helicase RhpA n=1 Tax=Cerasicoccus arenae TaxID=424488 RepID=A0A8J3D8Y6_9BACT|nr:DEAD/DEAH box helicase [Cerasicoccus arenae]MBK1858157.1 DEAD/DEAH box helicase [Cerasicoccus arenae]GHB96836.1 ATP-dependent RNA helicase RhlE [Cerasicoccus arenae]
MTFDELNLLPAVVQAVRDKGYVNPTPIQEQAIPVVMSGKDVIGSAQTGTGKTAAFTLPLLSKLEKHSPNCPRALILEPTRELAGQVDEQLVYYGQHLDLTKVLIYGGVKYGAQLQALEAGADIVVATPGRLIDHLQQKNLCLDHLEILILDEVDRMLDMGFIDQVADIVRYCPKERQTLLFSATLPDKIQSLANWVLTDPERIAIVSNSKTADTVDHAIYPVDGIQKYDLLLAMLEKFDYNSVLIFTRTKIDADRVTRWLQDHDHSVTTMHADRSQSERKEALAGFKEGKYEILVATDIASRGLDVSGISHVINYNVPQNPEDYVHRIGRTGRAATEGEAYTLYSTDELAFLDAIERYIERPIPRRKLEDFRYRSEPDLRMPGTAIARKKRNRGFNDKPGGFGRRR